jgi:hypothetical protein
MLKQNPRRTPNERSSTGRSLTIALAVTGIAFGLAGCGEEEVAAPIAQNNAPPPPPKVVVPRVTPISELMVTHGIDPRIEFAEQFAPGNDAARIAILKFFDSMIKSDSASLGMMLNSQDRNELAALDADGSFEAATAEVNVIQVRSGMTPTGEEAVVAILQTRDSYQPQLWRYDADEYGGATFYSAPTPMNVMDKLSGDNWIQRWYQLLEEELAIAMQLDEEVEAPQRDLSKGSDANISGGAGGNAPGGPGRGRQPNRDRPKVDPPSHDPTAPG